MNDSSRATIGIAVKPGSKRPGLTIEADTVILRVRERPVDGAANAACLRALAEVLGVPPSRIELLRGHRSRQKAFAVHGLDQATALRRLRSYRAAGS